MRALAFALLSLGLSMSLTAAGEQNTYCGSRSTKKSETHFSGRCRCGKVAVVERFK